MFQKHYTIINYKTLLFIVNLTLPIKLLKIVANSVF